MRYTHPRPRRFCRRRRSCRQTHQSPPSSSSKFTFSSSGFLDCMLKFLIFQKKN
uniref:Uncharacterized protein n=1 Tax=Medicago truncatula TaxID=3880 RepID=Q2HRP0_MEDTR|nr:hypothetical protein MtrDRAFT_AC158464g32v2 [Medicago truncatula]